MKNHANKFLNLVKEALINVPEVDVFQVKNRLDKGEEIILIDVREDKELEVCKINQAIHIPMGTVPKRLNDIDSNKPVVVMCKSGGRSAQVCQYLNENGYSNIYNLNGGITNWALEIDSDMATY